MMGFRLPHLHCHIHPQYSDDDPCALIDVQRGNTRLPPAEWSDRLGSIRAAFIALRSS